MQNVRLHNILMEAHRVSRGIALLILNISNRWGQVISSMPHSCTTPICVQMSLSCLQQVATPSTYPPSQPYRGCWYVYSMQEGKMSGKFYFIKIYVTLIHFCVLRYYDSYIYLLTKSHKALKKRELLNHTNIHT